MKEENYNTNLPVLAKEKRISKLEERHPRLVSSMKRFGKVAGYSLGAVGFVALASLGGLATIPAIPVITSTIGITGAIGTLYKASNNLIYHNEKDLLFTARRGINSMKLFQRSDVMNKVKGLNPIQLSGLMTLNTLVGLDRYKSLINTSKFELENGNKIYNQEFSTKTHSINLKNFKLLEKMGFIKIDDISEKQGSTSLLAEKIGIGNTDAVKKYFKDLLSGNKEEIEKGKVDMHTIKFRLTDKKIDLIKMYEDYANNQKNGKRPDRLELVLFDSNNGILAPDLSHTETFRGKINVADKQDVERSNILDKKKKLSLGKPKKRSNPRKIGIQYDSLGRAYINYNAKESGVEMFQKIVKPKEKTGHQKFEEDYHVDTSNFKTISMEEKMEDKENNIQIEEDERGS